MEPELASFMDFRINSAIPLLEASFAGFLFVRALLSLRPVPLLELWLRELLFLGMTSIARLSRVKMSGQDEIR